MKHVKKFENVENNTDTALKYAYDVQKILDDIDFIFRDFKYNIDDAVDILEEDVDEDDYINIDTLTLDREYSELKSHFEDLKFAMEGFQNKLL
jgi:hypothetical protein